MKCRARINLPSAQSSVGNWVRGLFAERKLCGEDATMMSGMGEPLCGLHAEQFVDAVMSDDTVIGMVLAQRDGRPKTRDEARKRFLRALPP